MTSLAPHSHLGRTPRLGHVAGANPMLAGTGASGKVPEGFLKGLKQSLLFEKSLSGVGGAGPLRGAQ